VNALHRQVNVRVVRPDAGRDLGDCASLPEVEAKLDAAEPAFLVLARWDKERGDRGGRDRDRR